MSYQQNINNYNKGEVKKENSLRNIFIAIVLSGVVAVIVLSGLFYFYNKRQTTRQEAIERAYSAIEEEKRNIKLAEEKAAREKKNDSSERVKIRLSDMQIVDDNGDPVENNTKPFVTVEQMPSFPGGEVEMQKYIARNLKYPMSAQMDGTQGRVVVRFVVSKEGRVEEVQVVRGIAKDCDKEAFRVIKSMPRWIPGKHNGRNVPVYFTIPIVFRLN